jgi:hypothetical protein
VQDLPFRRPVLTPTYVILQPTPCITNRINHPTRWYTLTACLYQHLLYHSLFTTRPTLTAIASVLSVANQLGLYTSIFSIYQVIPLNARSSHPSAPHPDVLGLSQQGTGIQRPLQHTPPQLLLLAVLTFGRRQITTLTIAILFIDSTTVVHYFFKALILRYFSVFQPSFSYYKAKLIPGTVLLKTLWPSFRIVNTFDSVLQLAAQVIENSQVQLPCNKVYGTCRSSTIPGVNHLFPSSTRRELSPFVPRISGKHKTFKAVFRLQRQLHHRLNLPHTVPHYLDSFRTIILHRQQEIEQETLQLRRTYRQIPPLDPISDPASMRPVPVSRSAQEITGPLYLPPQPQGHTTSDSSPSSSSTLAAS